MVNKWSNGLVGDFFDLVSGYAFKSFDFSNDGIPVIKIKNIKAGHFSKHQFSYVLPDFLDTQSEKVALTDDLLISMSGNRHDGSPKTWVGKVALFREKDPYLINQRVGALRLKKDAGLDARFASFLLSSYPYQKLFISIATSSGGQANLSPRQILSASIQYPEIAEQRVIAHILGTLDDKIELNRRMNETLEEMARALFKSWFVDFDPVRAKMQGRNPSLPKHIADLFPDRLVDSEMGKIPEGWEVKTLGKCFNLTMGQSPPSISYNDDGEGLPFFQGRTYFGFRYPESRKFCTAPTRIAWPGDTLVSVRAPVGEINMAWTQCCIGRGVAALRHKSASSSFTYYSAWTIQRNISVYEHTGTVFGAINKKQLEALQTLEPGSELIEAFDAYVSPMDFRIKGNTSEVRILTDLRNVLLPKLISGEMRVNMSEHSCLKQILNI